MRKKDAREDWKEVRGRLRREAPPANASDFAARAEAVREARQTLDLALRVREKDWGVYEEALRRWREAYHQAYPPGFWDKVVPALRAGDPDALETVIQFLEADPYFFGSGYAKEKLIRGVRKFDLSPEHVRRLQIVILDFTDRRYGQEYRSYCHLARKVDTPVFRDEVRRRLDATDPDVAVRARQLWNTLQAKDRGQ